jgi:hypothetical protein
MLCPFLDLGCQAELDDHTHVMTARTMYLYQQRCPHAAFALYEYVKHELCCWEATAGTTEKLAWITNAST